MRVEMQFDHDTVENQGYTLEDIQYTIQSAFARRGLLCTVKDKTLIFEGTGKDKDFAIIGNLLIDLLKADWFVNCASSCVFIDDDDSEENVLSQASEIRRMMA